ncbi:hypothetical protein HAP48_0004145 [Bradyrhizobium septentrionale]|uniref:Nucleotide modification associated domain-containing protein n=1 Tax=Bradyrhizobium septentrionale TaxID=1404411 RepID=A0A973W6H8_9BRAD|nr:hypothetical protein [Bradyrhizobium septentrionale]UGY16746.1 hypothetical protein HAP48_0004145 [Bradyrhizobium septentrionale]
MRISFSRKGFDSAAGGAPSPIIDGKPISLPIPTRHRSDTTYGDVGLGKIVERVTHGRISGSDLCHRDPMFQDNCCAFGQVAAAQSHLDNHGFGVGDVFLFYGLFADERGRDRHHRIFGYLRVSEKLTLGSSSLVPPHCLEGFQYRHPHTIGQWNDNNTLYFGRGNVARSASQVLRLSKPGVVSCWQIPEWLGGIGLSYHSKPARWAVEGELKIVSRGQEFVTEDVIDNSAARQWVDDIIREIDEG